MVRGAVRFAMLALVLAVPVARASPPASARAAANPFADASVVPWSLDQKMGETENKLGMRAERESTDPLPGSEQIIVFGRRRAPTGSVETRHDSAGAEAWSSEAAQPYVPGLGDSCTYKSGCFDKGQEGLFTSIPALFGDR